MIHVYNNSTAAVLVRVWLHTTDRNAPLRAVWMIEPGTQIPCSGTNGGQPLCA